jgi:hypothetical protein
MGVITLLGCSKLESFIKAPMKVGGRRTRELLTQHFHSSPRGEKSSLRDVI